jgi:hypothetical protein
MLDWLHVILDVQLHKMHKYIDRALPEFNGFHGTSGSDWDTLSLRRLLWK